MPAGRVPTKPIDAGGTPTPQHRVQIRDKEEERLLENLEFGRATPLSVQVLIPEGRWQTRFWKIRSAEPWIGGGVCVPGAGRRGARRRRRDPLFYDLSQYEPGRRLGPALAKRGPHRSQQPVTR